MSHTNDELKVVRAAIINKAFSDRYFNCNRMLRDLSNVTDSYSKDDRSNSIGEELKSILKKNENDTEQTNAVLSKICDRLDALEARGQ
tara:strand:+ start:223 stop:486 length:264 start_codon:yes stop_codon:yes gene_type:complete